MSGGKLGFGLLRRLLLGLRFCGGGLGHLALLLGRLRPRLLDLLLLLGRDPRLFGGLGRRSRLVLLGLLGAFGNEPCLFLLRRL